MNRISVRDIPAIGASIDFERPHMVKGFDGKPITLESLPSPDTRRWVVRRKAEVIAAIRGGLLTEAEACARYRLSPEELDLWEDSINRAGIPGLRVTRIQVYRDHVPVRRASSTQPGRQGPGETRDLDRGWIA